MGTNKKTTVTLSIQTILNSANTLCDDNVDTNTLITYFNLGVGRINAYANLNLPYISKTSLTDIDTNGVYDVCKPDVNGDASFGNNKIADLLINFVSKTIREVDGYSQEANNFDVEFINLLVSFNSRFKDVIKFEYRLGEGQGGNVVQQKQNVRANFWLKKNRLF